MPDFLLFEYVRVPDLALVAGRIGGFLMFMPMVGGLAVPVRLRALLAIGLALMIAPLAPHVGDRPADLVSLAVALGGETALGALAGTVMRICFVGLQLAGQVVAQETGLAFGQVVDPASGVEGDTIGVLYAQVGLIAYLAVGGHRELFALMLRSFQDAPLLAAAEFVQRGPDLLVHALNLGCTVGLRIAAPVMLTLLLVNIALGFVSRTVPHLNVTVLGFTIKNLVAFVVMAATLPAAMEVFLGGMDTAGGVVAEWMGQEH
jgi:flagellar biosynthesis protein FliR